MADSGDNQFQSPANSFRFAFGGVNTRDVPDALPPGKYSVAQNIRSTGSNSIRTRPGYTTLYQAGSNAVTDIRGYSTLLTDSLPRFLSRDANGGVWLDNGSSVGNLAGNAGYGASLITFRPSESPQSWMYIGAEGDYQKFSAPDANNVVTQYKVGIAEPQNQVEACPLARQFIYFGGGNYNLSGNTTGSIAGITRLNDNTGVALLDPAGGAGAGRYSVQVGNNANAAYQSGMLVTIGANLAPLVEDVIPPIKGNLNIAAIQYVSGNNGNCVIVPTQMPLGSETPGAEQLGSLRRGALVKIGGTETVFVQGLIEGPNSLFAFTASTNNTWTAGANLTGIPTIIVNGNPSSPANQNISSTGVSANFTTGIGAITQTLPTSPFAMPMFGGVYPQESDYVHVPLQVSDPTQLVQILILFNVDGNNFTNNVFYYTVRPSDFANVLSGNQTVLGSILQAAENEIIGNLAPAGSSPPAQGSTGNSQWIEIAFPVSSLSRLGDDQSRSLANCNAMQIQVNTANNITVGLGDVYIGGGAAPDTGNNGSPYMYQCVPLSSLTGVRGNPTPVMRYGCVARRQPVYIKTSALNNAYDPQIDTWEVFRYGGSVTSYRFVGTTPVGVDFTDTSYDAAAESGDVLPIDNTEPWPSIDVPYRANNAAAVGPFLTIPGNNNAFPSTITRWLPGTLVQVGGQEAYTLRSRPTSLGANNGYLFHFEECLNTGNQNSVFVLEPNVARQTLPYLWGPNEQGYMFGCGDPLRPGVLQWCKAFTPDSVPTAYDLELCPPSEPLLGGEVLSGVSLVASSLRWWALYFQSGGNPLYSQVEVPVGRRLAAPFGKCNDGKLLYFWATDCIAATAGTGAAISLTDTDLYNLFPHGGSSGNNVVRGSITFYAPDYSRAATFRISVREGIIYALYQDSNGIPRVLIGEIRGEVIAWSTDAYADSMTAVYSIEQPKGTLELAPSLYPAVVMGSNAGRIFKFQDFTGDNNNGITAKVGTPEWNGGDFRSDELWGDQYVDVVAPAGMTVTPVYQGNSVCNSTVIAASNNRQFVPVSLAGGQLLNFLGLDLTWTDYAGNQATPTRLHGWQPSFIQKPETTQDRFGDWYDFGQASYVRGLILHADTFGQNKNISVRNADNNALMQFSGGPAPGIINHNNEQQIAYYFTPFVAHMLRDEPQDQVPWRKFGIEWIKDAWPELTDLDSPWINMGTPQAKFIQGAVIPLDTNGKDIEIEIISSGGLTRTIQANTTAGEKSPTPFSWAPFIGHEIQLRPSSPVRIWWDEIVWVFEPTPELASTWTIQWTALGSKGYKHIPRIEISYSSTADVSLTVTSFDGTSPQPLTLPATVGVTQKILLTLTLNKGQLYLFSATSEETFQIFAEDFIAWVFDWGRMADARPYPILGGSFGDKARI